MTLIASLIPIVNNQQKLIALAPVFANRTSDDVLQLVIELQHLEFFEKLPALLFLLPVTNPLSLPIDLNERIPSKSVVLCIRESACVEPEAQLRLHHFLLQGFRIFMDDFDSKSCLIWPGTNGIAVSCRQRTPSSLHMWMMSLQNYQHYVKHVDSTQELQMANDAGFSLFSGDFAFSPSANNKTADPTARTRLLKLLGLVSRDAESNELETLFKQDAELSFMLLKLVSSAAFAQTVKIASFGQAINLLGRRQLQRWLQLLLYARQQGQGTALNPLMLRAAYRASFMEVICRHHGGNRDEQDGAFMVGMFSLLDLLFGCPLWEILKPLSLPENIVNALLERNGPLGVHLKLVEAADREGQQSLEDLLCATSLDVDVFYQSLIQAYVWVNQVCQDM